MKIMFLLSVVLWICMSPTDAATFITNLENASLLNVSFKVKKIAPDGGVAIADAVLAHDKTLDDLRKHLQISSKYQFFYNQTPLLNQLTMREYMTCFTPWKERGFNLVAIPPGQVEFAMHYFSIEKKYRELTPREYYTYSSGASVYLQVDEYIHKIEEELDASIAKEIKQLIALYTSIRCTPLYAPWVKKALANPVQTKLLLTSAYQEQVGSLVLDLLTPFIMEDKPCEFLTTLPKEAIPFLYMYKDHFLHVKLLRWLTYTQQSPLLEHSIAAENKPSYLLKKSCIDSLFANGVLTDPLSRRVSVEARRIKAWDVVLSLIFHDFLRQ